MSITPRPTLKTAILTTPTGLESSRYLAAHLNVVGILIDDGPWGKTPTTLGGRVKRRVRHLRERLHHPSAIEWSELGVPVVRTHNINSQQARDTLAKWQPDLGAIVGGRIVKRETFSIPRLGTINKHSSLLPRHRGLAAEYWCLYHGDLDALGVTVHFVDEGCDTGPILVQRPMTFHQGDTPATLRVRSDMVGREAIVDAVELIEQTGTRGVEQNETLATTNGKPTEQTDRELEARMPDLWRRYAA